MDNTNIQSDAKKFATAMIIASANSEGEIVADSSGEYSFWPKGFTGGAFTAFHLRTLADELDRRNQPLTDHINAYFAEHPPGSTQSNDTDGGEL